MDKRENLLSLLVPDQQPAYIPAAFFTHFDAVYHRGQPAVDKHLEFFHATGMDFMKIGYEHPFPHLPDIQKPEDWAKVPLYKEDFYEEPLHVVREVVKALKGEAVVVTTLALPFILARWAASDQLVTDHMREDPEAVKKGLKTITESLLYFVRGCKQAGVDGFCTSSMGAEARRFKGTRLFEEYVKPFDLEVWHEIGQSCAFNVLHVCDFEGGYDDLSAFLDYPAHVINCSLKVGEKELTAQETSSMFNRPFMGGVNRYGVIASGNPEQVRLEAEGILARAPDRFILSADCTVPTETPWDNLKSAIDTARNWATRP